jgi:signal peptidase I
MIYMLDNFEYIMFILIIATIIYNYLYKNILLKNIEFIKSILIVSLFSLIIHIFFCELVIVPTESMVPTIKAHEILLITKYDHFLKKLEYGDIVIFHYPVKNNVLFIKRVVALPGDKISYINKNLIINNVIQKTIITTISNNEVTLKEQFIKNIHNITYNTLKNDINFYNLKIPDGYVFVMGDNRDNSSDSRYWGLLPINYIMGKAQFILFSYNNLFFNVRWERIFTILH